MVFFYVLIFRKGILMDLDKLRYSLTQHIEKLAFTYENFKLLIHPSVCGQFDLINRIMDDIDLMPEIMSTQDKVEIKFYDYDYNKDIFNKSELLAFIFASINSNWNIIKGIDLETGNSHFWLKNDTVVFDPSLAILTSDNIYLDSKRFKSIKEIKNNDVNEYLRENNNLFKFYKKGIFKDFYRKNNLNFSLNFINKILEEFNRNIESQYILDDERIKKIKENFWHDNYIELRQVLSKKRKSFLQSNKIAVHPSVDLGILNEIEKVAYPVSQLMKQEYDIYLNYYENTLGKCYGLSIMFNLFNGNFKLIQGGIPYKEEDFNIITDCFYQHSWLEKGDIIYDPALRVVTPKDLYYIFVQKQDEYSKEQTENMLRRIGFNLTHFRDFLNGVQIGNSESISYMWLLDEIDSPEMKEQGEKLLSFVKKYNR